MTLTGAGGVALGFGTLLAIVAIALDDPSILAAAIVCILALALSRPPAEGVRIQASATPFRVMRGGEAIVTCSVTLPRGFGDAEIEQPLPDAAEIMEGSNVAVARMGQTVELRMRVRFPQCGLQRLPPARAILRDPLAFRSPVEVRATDGLGIEVFPRIARGRTKPLRLRASRFGAGSGRALVGVEGDEYVGVRPYVAGDPPRRVNWKATARFMAADPEGAPLVNEPERRGRRVVWLILDPDPVMLAMSPSATGGRLLDDALEAAARIAQDAITRGDLVGVSGPGILLRPSAGRRGTQRVIRALARIEPAKPLHVPPRPLLSHATAVLLTRLPFPRDDLADAVRELRAANAHVVVLELEGPATIPPEGRREARVAIAGRAEKLVTWTPGERLAVKA
ncbi:MAG: DUF58 domain-containing protein [Thermoplasmatota archaeon]